MEYLALVILGMALGFFIGSLFPDNTYKPYKGFYDEAMKGWQESIDLNEKVIANNDKLIEQIKDRGKKYIELYTILYDNYEELPLDAMLAVKNHVKEHYPDL